MIIFVIKDTKKGMKNISLSSLLINIIILIRLFQCPLLMNRYFFFYSHFQKNKIEPPFWRKNKKYLKKPDCPAGQSGKVTPFNSAIASFRVKVSFLNATNREPKSAEGVVHVSIAIAEEQEARECIKYGARPVVTVYTNVAERTIIVVAAAC